MKRKAFTEHDILCTMARRADPSACYALFGHQLCERYLVLRSKGVAPEHASEKCIAVIRELLQILAVSSPKIPLEECYQKAAQKILGNEPAEDSEKEDSKEMERELGELQAQLQSAMQREYGLFSKRTNGKSSLGKALDTIVKYPALAVLLGVLGITAGGYLYLASSESTLSINYTTRSGDQYYLQLPNKTAGNQKVPETPVQGIEDFDSLVAIDTTPAPSPKPAPSKKTVAPTRKASQSTPSRRPAPSTPSVSTPKSTPASNPTSLKKSTPAMPRESAPEPPQSRKPTTPKPVSSTPASQERVSQPSKPPLSADTSRSVPLPEAPAEKVLPSPVSEKEPAGEAIEEVPSSEEPSESPEVTSSPDSLNQ